MKTTLSVFSLVFGLTLAANATVTLEFSQPFAGGIASNFANAAGTPTDGMQWGIVVETVGSTFANNGTSYNAYAAGATTAGFLSANGSVTNDYYIPSSALTANSSGQLEGDFATAGGHGTIYNSDPITLSGGVAAGDKFAIVWFNTNSSNAGDNYGFFTDASFVLPADGSTTPYDTVFTGPDPARPANNTFIGLSPEPSRMLLLGFGAVAGLMVRRRRVLA